MCQKQYFYPSLAAVALVATYIVNFTVLSGTFDNEDDESTTLNPSGWAFSIWGVIYIWQAAWVGYSFYVTCQSNNDALYFSSSFWIWFILSCISNIIWCFLARYDILLGTGIAFIFLDVTLYGAIYYAHKYLFYDLPNALTSDDFGDNNVSLQDFPTNLAYNNDITLFNSYLLVLNGLMIYSGWGTIAFFVNWAIILKIEFNLSNDTSTLIMGGLAALWLLLYFYFDLIKFRYYLSKSYTFYIPLIVAFVGILDNYGFDTSLPSSVLVAALLLVTIVCLSIKIVINCCCQQNVQQLRKV